MPRYVLDRLALRKIAYQTVGIGITKDLQSTSKIVWPTFPIQVGVFSLENVNHAKLEVATLENKLSYSILKKHDPLNIVWNHCDFLERFKKYSNEDKPFDDVFRRVKYD